ncbi:hypothetical protein B0J14DRAFT_517437, partial [Halenospora varia]
MSPTNTPTGFPMFTKNWHNTTYPSISSLNPALSATGKTIVITGGGSGIGAATVLSFAQAGASNIAILGRREANLVTTAESIRAQFPKTKVLVATADITNSSSLTEAFKKISESFGTIDVMVSNAGYLSRPVTILESDEKDWWKSIETNVLGTFNIARAFAPLASPSSTFVNVSSGVGHMPAMPGVSAYAAGKIANAKLAEYIAFDLGSKGVKVYSVQPGSVDTDMNAKGREAVDIPPMDDASLPADFSVWLASPEATFLRGRFVWVNWDVDELKARKEEFVKNPLLLTMGLDG